jgi:hypothetical protein
MCGGLCCHLTASNVLCLFSSLSFSLSGQSESVLLFSSLYFLVPVGWTFCQWWWEKLWKWLKWGKATPVAKGEICQCWFCSETMLTGESRFHRSTPQGIWTWVPCDGKQTGSPLDQWDMVKMKWDCKLSTGLPPSSRLRGCGAGRETCSERETGTGKLCEFKWDYHIVGTRA